MRKIRFILQGCGQTGVDTYKDYYCTEIVEVSDRAYELLVADNRDKLVFMGAEPIEEVIE
jgi:hypothetical protein